MVPRYVPMSGSLALQPAKLMMTAGMKTAYEHEDQRGDQADEQDECQVGQALFQPLRADPPGPEEGLVDVENPKRSRDQEQDYAHNCVSEVQSHVMIHDGLSYDAQKSNMSLAAMGHAGTLPLPAIFDGGVKPRGPAWSTSPTIRRCRQDGCASSTIPA